jgi:hypothetical protein
MQFNSAIFANKLAPRKVSARTLPFPAKLELKPTGSQDLLNTLYAFEKFDLWVSHGAALSLFD